MFYGSTLLHECKETILRNSDQEAFPSAGKNTVIVLAPCHAWKCVPTALSGSIGISNVFGCQFLHKIDEFSVRVTKVTSRIEGSVSQRLTAYLILTSF